MTIVYDFADPAVLTAFARDLPIPGTIGLNAYLPDRMIDDVEALIDELTRTNTATTFRAFDAETPIGKRDTYTRKRIALPPLGQKTVIGEFETLQLARLNGRNDASLIRSIYDDVELNARAVRIRMELARGDLLTDGKVTITENGLVGLESDFAVPGGNIVTAAITWATASTDIPTELMTWLDYYADNCGEPGRIVVSRTVARYMLNNDKLRLLAGFNGVTPSTLGLGQLNGILASYGYPPVEIYNSSFDVAGVTTRAIPVDKLLILPLDPTELGYTAWGITAEALKLAGAQRLSLADAPGLVAVNMETDDPVALWTKVGAVGMPVLVNARKLFVADVVP